MTQNDALVWCNALSDSWKNVDFNRILEIFSETKCYYEDPFSEPGSTPEDIQGFWDEIQYQKINKLNIVPIAIDGHILIARWFLDYVDIRTNETYVMDGIYQVEFNAAKKCIKFIQWWVMKE